MKKLYALLFLGLVAFLVSFKVDDRLFELAKNIEIFGNLYKNVNMFYVDEVNPTKSMNKAIKSILEDLDPYTVFYPENVIENSRLSNSDELAGIGVELLKENVVSEVYLGSIAEAKGLKVGDKIVSINTIPTSNLDKDQIEGLLGGEKGSLLSLKVERRNVKNELSFELEREFNDKNIVPYYGMLNDEVGYIQLLRFEKSAAKELKSAYDFLASKGMKTLVIDLRGNPGGLVNMAGEICNFFLPKGKLVVNTKGKNEKSNFKYVTKAEPLDAEIPIAVLVNRKSASASEIVSGTLQDYDRAVIIGQRSFGKGLVQQYKNLNYNTIVKITIAKYYTPSGRCIQALDYSHRNPDGSVGEVPKELINTFKTEHGRSVKDGGGIMPDIEVESQNWNDLVEDMDQKMIFFNFATDYLQKYPNTKAGFSLTANDLNDFFKFINSENYIYSPKADKNLAEFYEKSPNKKELSSAYKELVNLNNKLNKEQIEKSKDQIAKKLQWEINRRLYPENKELKKDFSEDKEVKEALSLFEDLTRYKKILK